MSQSKAFGCKTLVHCQAGLRLKTCCHTKVLHMFPKQGEYTFAPNNRDILRCSHGLQEQDVAGSLLNSAVQFKKKD